MSKRVRKPLWVWLLGGVRVMAWVCFALVAALLLTVMGGVYMNVPRVDVAGPLSPAEFSARRPDWPALPPGTENVYYAHSSKFHGFVTLVRLDAPADACREFAEKLLREHDKLPEFETIESPPDPFMPNFFSAVRLDAVDWYDLDQINSGVAAYAKPTTWPGESVWIDTDRNRFYYFSSD